MLDGLLRRATRRRGRWATGRQSNRQRCLVDGLEPRVLLSTISWTNRGQTSDGFAAVFGTNVNLARSVIDAVIQSWEREIINFNYPGGGNTYSITISTAVANTGQGAATNVNSYASNGAPESATMNVLSGTNGHGAGYFLDPNPLNSTAFVGTGSHTDNAYAAYAPSSSPAYAKGDLYELVLHEMGHAMGFVPNSHTEKYSFNTNVVDTVDSTQGGVSPAVGHYWAFDGPDGNLLTTDFNDLGNNQAEEQSGPAHYAAAGAQVTSGGITYYGSDDLMTPYYASGQRRQISRDDLIFLQDSYGYLVQSADYYGNAYDELDSSGELHVSVPPSGGNNTIFVTEAGGELNVELVLGNPVKGADPTSLDTYYSISAVSSIDIVGGGGNDSIILGAPGNSIPVTVNGGGGGTDSLTVNNVGTNTTVYSGDVTGSNLDLASLSFIEQLTLNAGSAGSSFIVDGLPASGRNLSIVGGAGNDTLGYGEGNLTTAPAFSFDGGAGTNTVNVLNNKSTGNWAYALSDGKLVITGPSKFTRTDTFTNVTGYILTAGTGNQSFYTSMGSTADTVTLVGGSGNDLFQLQPDSLSQLVGAYNIQGSGAADTLMVEDSSNNNLEYIVTSAGISDEQMSVVATNVGSMVVNSGNGSDSTEVGSLPSYSVSLYEGRGTDSVEVGVSSHELPSFANGFAVHGYVNDNTDLTLDDSGDANTTSTTVTSTTFTDGAGTLTYSGLLHFMYDEGEASNTLNVNGAATGTAYDFNCGDTTNVNVGNGDLTNLINTSFVGRNNLSFNDPESLNISDQNDATARTYSLAGQYTFATGTVSVGTHLQISFIGGCPLNLTGGIGNDTFTLTSNTYDNPVAINTGLGNDAVTVGSTAQTLGSSVGANVTVTGGGGTDSLTVYDPSEDDLSVTSTYVAPSSGTTPVAQTNYSGFSNLAITHGDSNAGGSITVASTAAGTPVTLVPAAGNEPITVTTTSSTAPVTITPSAGVDPVTVGPAGTATGTAVVDFAATQTIGLLTINHGGTAVVTPSTPHKVLIVNGLGFPSSSAGTGKLDLTDNDLIIHNGIVQQVQSQVDTGYANGAENGTGILTSTGAAAHRTLGVLLNQNSSLQPIYTTFDGQAVGNQDVLVKYTLFGDANLDGKVNLADFGIIKQNFGSTGGTLWSNGDFNDDGRVNLGDFGLLKANFGMMLST